MNQIKKAVRKFAKENDLYGRPLTVGTLERVIINQGYEIVYYDLLNLSVKARVLSDQLNLQDKFQNNTGFTYCQPDIKAVFVKQTLNEKDKLSALIHEEAHIYLDHFYRHGLDETTIQHEKEANAFELALYKEIQNDKKWMVRIIAPTVAALSLAAILIFRAYSPDVPKPTGDTLFTTSQTDMLAPDTSKSDSTNDTAPVTIYESDSGTMADHDTRTYYWTQSGTVYHIYADCGHLKNSIDVQSGSKDQSNKERCCKTCYSRYLRESHSDSNW